MRARTIEVVGLWAVLLSASVVGFAVASGNDLVAEAVKRQDKAALHALLKQRVDVNTPQADCATALHWATHWDDVETADLLIRAGANVNAANELGVTPLALACVNGNAAMVQRLLKAGANPNVARVTGETALMTGAWTGNPDVVKALLAHGANVNATERSKGQTALMWAVAQRHPEVTRLLLEHGADVHAFERKVHTVAVCGPVRRHGGRSVAAGGRRERQ